MALDLDDLIVAPDTPLLEALKRLDQTGLEVVLVCDGQKSSLVCVPMETFAGVLFIVKA